MLNKQTLISIEDALPGRDQPMQVEDHHFVNKSNLKAPLEPHQQQILLGMGCFWGAERVFWQLNGVISTSVGYAGGYTPNPTYEEVCTGKTGHTEVVRVVFDERVISLEKLLAVFWEKHDPTQGCVKVTIWAHNTVRLFTLIPRSSKRAQKNRSSCINKHCKRNYARTSPLRYSQRARIILPKLTTSNIWLKTLTVTAVSVAQVFAFHPAYKVSS